MTVETLRSEAAGSGPPLFFPDPEVPTVFNFDQGLAAPETFPTEDLLRLGKQALAEDGASVLDYFDPDTGYEELVFGYRGLRQQISDRIERMQGRSLGHLGVILTSGSVQGIALTINAYVDPGDVVIAEAASFPYALRYIDMAGGELRTVAVDDNGMDTAAVEEMIAAVEAEGKRVKMVYTIPTFQTPTGTVMSLSRRKHLVSLAEEHGFVVVEDDVYGDLRFAGEPLPTLLSLASSGLVLQCGSFSKTVAPALRLGWIAGTPKAIEPLANMRQDLGVGQWHARVMARYMAEGLLEKHIEEVVEVYRSKAETAADAMRRYCGNYVSFSQPQGSFYLWLEIHDNVDWDEAAARAAREGIFFRPGERFMGESDGRRFLRLAYSHISEEVIENGIKRLGEILSDCAK